MFYELAGTEKSWDVTVADGQTIQRDFQMKRVEASSPKMARGTVVFADGTPAPGARLLFDYSDGGRSSGVADLDGRFYFAADTVLTNSFMVCARLGLLASHPISSKAGGDFTLTLLPNLWKPLEGRVVDEKGKPIEGATISARKNPNFTDAGERTSGADGTFSFQRMPTDWNYRVSVSADGYRTLWQTVSVKNGEFPPVVFKLRPTVTPVR
jgi:hypothetical protein